MVSDSTRLLDAKGTCPFCGVTLRDCHVGIIAEETGEPFAVEACPECGLGRTQPAPDDLDRYYDATYYGQRHGATARLCIRRRLELVRRWAKPASGRRLLDFGCGDGGFALASLAEGWTCSGVERSHRQTAPTRLTIVTDLDDLNDSPAFDVATLWHVMEHLVDPVGTLVRIRSRLGPDGLVIVAVPNFASWQSRVTGASWLHLDLPRHLWHFTPDSLRRVLTTAGFRVEEITYGEIEYDTIGWSQSLLNRYLGGRNEFFRVVSGRPGSRGLRTLLHVPLGLALSAPMAGLAWLESRAGRGGTLIMAARRTPG